MSDKKGRNSAKSKATTNRECIFERSFLRFNSLCISYIKVGVKDERRQKSEMF